MNERDAVLALAIASIFTGSRPGAAGAPGADGSQGTDGDDGDDGVAGVMGPAGPGNFPTFDTYANLLLLTPEVGDIAYATDGGGYTLFCRVAGVWAHYWGTFEVQPPPAPTIGWTAYNGGVMASVGGTLQLRLPVGAPAGWQGATRVAPAGDYHVIAGIRPGAAAAASAWGLMWKAAAAAPLVVVTEGSLRTLDITKYNTPSSFNSSYRSIVDTLRPGSQFWWGLQFVDGVSREVFLSTDRFATKTEIHTVGDADFIDPDLIGWLGFAAWPTAISPVEQTLFDWEVGAGPLPGAQV